MICSRCQGQNSDDLNYCGHCGAPLRSVCPKCGQAFPVGLEICPSCGYRLQGESPQSAKEKKIANAPVSPKVPVPLPPSRITCPSCGYSNRPDICFCERCGQPISVSAQTRKGNVACPNCGNANRPGVQFCEQCGASLYLRDQKKQGMRVASESPLWLRVIGRFAIGSVCGFVSTKLGLVLVNYLAGQN